MTQKTSNQPQPQLDWLAIKTLASIEASRPELAEWIQSKKYELDGKDRLGVLRWICSGLDRTNQAIVCQSLEVHQADLESAARVLQKI
ncbi:MAG: hypothetical protein ACOVLH_13215 [Roseateles sp.]